MSKSSVKIEQAAVNCIEEAFFNSDLLCPSIPTNDREPVWDGNIYINYGNHNFSRIPTQVKGKIVKKLPTKVSYPISVTDLYNYMRDGGVVYFVVYIIEDERYAFYKLLAPIDLKRHIRNAQGRKSLNITLEPLPKVDKQLEQRFVQFDDDCKRQTSFVDSQTISLEDAVKKGYTLNYHVHRIGSKEDMVKYMSSTPIYLYANIGDKDNPIFHPVGDQAYKLSLSSLIEKPVKCGNEIFYQKYQVEQVNSCLGVNIGNFVNMVLLKDSKTINFKLTFSLNNLLELENQLNFAKAIIKEGQFYIGEERISLEGIEENIKIEIEELYQFWDGLFKTLKCLNCDLSKIDASVFSESDYDNLEILKKAILYKEEIYQDHDISGITIVKLGNHRIILFAEKTSSGNFKVKDFFKIGLGKKIELSNGKAEKYIATIFSAVLFRSDVDKIINFDYQNFIKSYEEAYLHNNNLPIQANCDVLAMINAYDKMAKKDDRLLNYALKLVEWIWLLPEKGTIKEYICKLNRYQIIKRLKNRLEYAERDSLLGIAEASDLPACAKWGANLLLEDYDRASMYWQKMTEKEKSDYKTFPIYWFVKEKGLEENFE